jgi:hypothetical protein
MEAIKGNSIVINRWYTVYDLRGSYDLIVGKKWMVANPHIIDHCNNTLRLLGEGWSLLGDGQPNLATPKSIMGVQSHQRAMRVIQIYCTSVAEVAELTLITADDPCRCKAAIMAVNILFTSEVASNVESNGSDSPYTSDLPLLEFNQ